MVVQCSRGVPLRGGPFLVHPAGTPWFEWLLKWANSFAGALGGVQRALTQFQKFGTGTFRRGNSTEPSILEESGEIIGN